MILVLHGENSLFTRRKLDEIIASYKAKHASGLAFFIFDASADFSDFKSAWETVSMFEEKKLLVLKNILSDKKIKEEIVTYLRAHSAKEDKDRIVVFAESGTLVKKSADNAWLCEEPSIVQESKNPVGAQLSAWIIHEAKKQGAEIDADAVAFLAQACPGDVWRLSSEIAKLARHDRHITKEHAKLLVHYNETAQVFDAVSALAEKNIAQAIREFSRVLGEQDWAGVLGLIVYQFRAIVKARILLDEKASMDAIEKEMGMHPFALRKTLGYAKKYTRAQAESLFDALCDMDAGLKTGRISFEPALEHFALRVAGLITK